MANPMMRKPLWLLCGNMNEDDVSPRVVRSARPTTAGTYYVNERVFGDLAVGSGLALVPGVAGPIAVGWTGNAAVTVRLNADPGAADGRPIQTCFGDDVTPWGPDTTTVTVGGKIHVGGADKSTTGFTMLTWDGDVVGDVPPGLALNGSTFGLAGSTCILAAATEISDEGNAGGRLFLLASDCGADVEGAAVAYATQVNVVKTPT